MLVFKPRLLSSRLAVRDMRRARAVHLGSSPALAMTKPKDGFILILNVGSLHEPCLLVL
jgi:hypothetical protein